jgi:two-component system response regulator TctD
MRILIIEDDAALARGLVATLRSAGYAVDLEVDGADALPIAMREDYALIVLDLGLPGMDGLEVLRQLRRAGRTMPVMILTARDAVPDRVRGLNFGADDYLVKPFDPLEFEARVRAHLRRGKNLPNPELRCGTLLIDRNGGMAWLNNASLDLRPRELAVLTTLVVHAGKVVHKERLAAAISGFDDALTANALEQYVARLRRKLEAGGPEIRTIRGLGYLIETKYP